MSPRSTLVTRRQLLGAAAAVVAGGASCSRPQNAVGAAPDFSLADSRGKIIRLSNYLGKVVLLDFWATWCTGCKVEIPWFIEFAEIYRDRGLVVAGVSFDEKGWDAVRPFLREMKVNYPVVLGDEVLSKQYEVTALPTTLLINKEGKIAFSHVGLADKAEFERQIERLL